MNARVILPVAALIGVTAFGCERPQPTEPVAPTPLFAAATKTAVDATVGPLAATGPAERAWFSDGILHFRGLPLAGPVTGDIEGTFSALANTNQDAATGVGTGWGTFTITTAYGTWEGSFQGRFDVGGLFADKVVAGGSGGLDGLKLTGTFAETGPATNIYDLTAEILNPGR